VQLRIDGRAAPIGVDEHNIPIEPELEVPGLTLTSENQAVVDTHLAQRLISIPQAVTVAS